jgi:hypothetical protein
MELENHFASAILFAQNNPMQGKPSVDFQIHSEQELTRESLVYNFPSIFEDLRKTPNFWEFLRECHCHYMSYSSPPSSPFLYELERIIPRHSYDDKDDDFEFSSDEEEDLKIKETTKRLCRTASGPTSSPLGCTAFGLPVVQNKRRKLIF